MSISNGALGRRVFLGLGGLALSVSLAGVLMRPASAATLDEMKKKGVITFGIVTDQPPFSYINAKGENEGYDIEISQLIAKGLGLKAEYVTITSANRIPQLLTGKVDMLICVLGIFPDRAKVIQYVAPYAEITGGIYGPKDGGVSKVDDLNGHTVALEKGSSVDKTVSDSAPKGTKLQRFDDASSAVQALLSGQVEYLGSYSHQFLGVEKAAPGKFAEKLVLLTSYEGIAVAQQSQGLAQWADKFWASKVKDGTANALYQKHFGKPYPEMPRKMDGITFTTN